MLSENPTHQQVIEYIKILCIRIKTTTDKGWNWFDMDIDISDGTAKKIEEIGESVKKLSFKFYKDYPEIDWRDLMDTRNLLAHQYGSFPISSVWKVATEVIPELFNVLTDVKENRKYIARKSDWYKPNWKN